MASLVISIFGILNLNCFPINFEIVCQTGHGEKQTEGFYHTRLLRSLYDEGDRLQSVGRDRR